MPRRRASSRRRVNPPARPPSEPKAPAPPVDPLLHLSPEGREFAISKADAEDLAGRGVELPLAELVLTLPGYDPRVQAGDCWFDEAAAQKAIDFYSECLTHIEGEWSGSPFLLSPWQKAIVANLFGWKRPDGMRRYREMYLEVPRKNGKTPLAAGIVLILLVMDGEPGAQIYSAAGDKEQAALLFRHAAGMVENDPDLSQRVIPYYAGKSLEYRRNGSFYKAISKESKTKHGYNSHGVIVDELHVHPNSLLVDTLTSSTGTRRQPLIVYITTRDYVRPSICNEKAGYAEKVAADLVKDPEFLPVLYRMPDGAAWDDEATWKIANPNYGVSVKPEEIAREARKAKQIPRLRNEFIRLRLNGATQAEVAWIPQDLWKQCGSPLIHGNDVEGWIRALGLDGMKCYGAVDLGAVKDLSAFALFFPDVAALLTYFWAPKATAEKREQQEGVSYTTWSNEGLITLVPGRKVDFDYVLNQVLESGLRFNLQGIAFDRWAASSLMTKLEGEGFDVIGFGQGYKDMTPACRAFEELWLEEDPEKRLKHGGHEVLAWNASNVMAETDAAGNVKLSKKKSTERIDGIVASVMAVGISLGSVEGAYGDGKGFRS